MKIPKIILSRPKLVVDTRCPKCNSLDTSVLPTIETQCKNCKTIFRTDVKINIYFSIAKKLISSISKKNEVWILGERDASDIFHTEDLLKPRSQHEDDVYQTMLAIKHNFDDQLCYEVGKITNEVDEEYRIKCNDCAICYNCVTCTKCGQKYIPKKVNTPQGEQKKYKCTNCGNRFYDRTYIKEFKKGCPYCGSENVMRTHFGSNLKQCPKCKSKNITKPKAIPVYKLVIKRQKRFMKLED